MRPTDDGLPKNIIDLWRLWICMANHGRKLKSILEQGQHHRQDHTHRNTLASTSSLSLEATFTPLALQLYSIWTAPRFIKMMRKNKWVKRGINTRVSLTLLIALNIRLQERYKWFLRAKNAMILVLLSRSMYNNIRLTTLKNLIRRK